MMAPTQSPGVNENLGICWATYLLMTIKRKAIGENIFPGFYLDAFQIPGSSAGPPPSTSSSLSLSLSVYGRRHLFPGEASRTLTCFTCLILTTIFHCFASLHYKFVRVEELPSFPEIHHSVFEGKT
ncbi:unnamed protein product [Victoria cruziana]